MVIYESGQSLPNDVSMFLVVMKEKWSVYRNIFWKLEIVHVC